MQSKTEKRMQIMAEHKAAMAAMSVDHALHILSAAKRASPELVSLVQESLHHRKRHHSKHLRKHKITGVPKPDAGADYGAGTKNAVIRINEMLLETIMKLDEEELRCEARYEELETLLTEIAEDLQSFQASGSEATASKLSAFAAINDYTDFIGTTNTELQQHKGQCRVEKQELDQQHKTILSDQGVMDKILNMTDCSDSAYEKANAEGALLLECTDKSGRTFTRIRAHKELAQVFAKLKHPESRKLIDQIVVEGDSTSGNVMLLESGSSHKTLRKVLSGVIPQGMFGTLNATNGANEFPDQPEKCSIADSAKCPELRERFMNIAGGIADAREEVELMMGNLQTRCKTIENNLLLEIAHYELYLRQQQSKEAQAMADFASAQESTNKKELEQRETKQTLQEEKEKCHTIEGELKNEQCALDKIRDQLLNMSNLERHIIDCEVSVPWEYGECSKSCGVGQRILTRDVDVQAGPGPEDWQMGHKCPLIEAKQMCNTDRCPVDCVLNTWEEWGACSKICDGGIRERMRTVQVPKVAGGNPCEARVETEDCNMQACQVDCQLSDWSEWSTTCSKQCGVGQQTSFKTLEKPAQAGGSCASFYDPSRFRTKPCNEQACPYTKAWTTCRAKVDVVILVDGSASMGEVGFSAAKTFAANMAKAFSGEARVAELSFSGPDNMKVLSECEGITDGEVTVEQCGMHWGAHLTETDMPAAADRILAETFAQGPALTYLALSLAEMELANGRKDAQSVVILLTDGMPVRKFPMRHSAEELKKTARLMEVVVGSEGVSNAAEFKAWASAPWQNNVRFVESWDDITSSNSTLNAVIEDFCADMVFEK